MTEHICGLEEFCLQPQSLHMICSSIAYHVVETTTDLVVSFIAMYFFMI